MVELQGLPGFRDFYPDDLAARTYLLTVWRDVVSRYGFEEYDGPPLEPLELYTRKSGPEIVEQLYEFEDRGGRQVALRPEMTPTLARMIGERARALAKPIRWFSIPQLFRYERQQRGRLREHFQLNVDIVGEESVLADAELLTVAVDVVRTLGLDSSQVRARVSDRRLLSALFRHVGVPPARLESVYQVVDKLDREPRERLEERLDGLGLEPDTISAIFQITDVRGIDALESEFGSVESVARHLDALSRYLEHLEALGVSDFVDVDLSVVRGLAYYTGIVFELWDAGRELRAICGGGRYDDLLQVLSDIDMPALGFGMGDVVLGELLREHGQLPDYDPSVDCYIVAIGEQARRRALGTARDLRAAGLSTIYDLRDRSPRSQFKAADRAGARHVIVIGPDELEAGHARVREMETGAERTIDFERLSGEVRNASDDDTATD